MELGISKAVLCPVSHQLPAGALQRARVTQSFAQGAGSQLSHPLCGQKAQPVLRIPECTIPFVTISEVHPERKEQTSPGQRAGSREGPKGAGCNWSLGSVFISLGCFFSLPVPFHPITQTSQCDLEGAVGEEEEDTARSVHGEKHRIRAFQPLSQGQREPAVMQGRVWGEPMPPCPGWMIVQTQQKPRCLGSPTGLRAN